MSILKRSGNYLLYLREDIRFSLLSHLPRPTDEEILKHIAYSLGNAPDQKVILNLAAGKGLLVQEYFDHIADQIRFELWCREKFNSQTESLYLRYKKSLTELEYSMIRVRSKDLSFELFHQLEAEEANFFELASEYSLGRERRSGGFVGSFNVGDLLDEIADHLLTLEPGIASPPLQVGEFWVILKLDERRDPVMDDATVSRILKIAGEEHINNMLRERVKSIYDSE